MESKEKEINERKISKSTLLNIDSMFRDLYPKNITTSDGKTLPQDPFTLYQGSNLVTINYPSHNLSTGNNIVIQNVHGYSKTLSNYFFLINNFNYVMILFNNNMINSNYTDYTKYNKLYANIDLVGTQTESNIINNIAFNTIPGYKNTLIFSDIPVQKYQIIISSITQLLNDILGINFPSTDDMINYIELNCLFIKLPNDYINPSVKYYTINQVFKITYNHIGGIPLGYFNANFPISTTNYQSNYQITNVIDSNNFQITMNYVSYGNMNGGGKQVQIMKIINSITGYPDANYYVVNLKKSFNNVTKIDLVSTEISYVDIVIKKNINDKLYWKHIEDGDYLYSVQLEEGFYSTLSLDAKLETAMNLVPRITSTIEQPVYNNFKVTLETNLQKVTFMPYNIVKIPNKLTVKLETINSNTYYILNINIPQNFIQVNDIITISGSTNVTFTNSNSQIYSIDSTYINNTFKVYNVNIESQSFSVIIDNINNINTTLVTTVSNGGHNVTIKTQTSVSFYFNKSDTFGDILGFLHVGEPYSIIDYNTVITNKSSYINNSNLNSVGNTINYSSGFINLSGTYNYIIMKLNDIEYIYFNNNMNAAFAKIQLNGNPGDVIFNTYVSNPDNIYSKNFPIASLTAITVQFLYPDGSNVNFRNINHSFTLKITEEHNENDSINLNSNTISYIDEYKKTYL